MNLVAQSLAIIIYFIASLFSVVLFYQEYKTWNRKYTQLKMFIFGTAIGTYLADILMFIAHVAKTSGKNEAYDELYLCSVTVYNIAAYLLTITTCRRYRKTMTITSGFNHYFLIVTEVLCLLLLLFRDILNFVFYANPKLAVGIINTLYTYLYFVFILEVILTEVYIQFQLSRHGLDRSLKDAKGDANRVKSINMGSRKLKLYWTTMVCVDLIAFSLYAMLILLSNNVWGEYREVCNAAVKSAFAIHTFCCISMLGVLKEKLNLNTSITNLSKSSTVLNREKIDKTMQMMD